MDNEFIEPIKKISGVESHFERFVVCEDKVLVSESIRPYSYVKVKSGVCILPIYQDKVVVLREYRYPIASFEYELPGGSIDENESVFEAAKRELYEESGLIVDSLIDLGYFYPSFGSTDEKIYLCAALCSKREKPHMELSEVIEYVELSYDELFTLIHQNEFRHGAGLVAILKYFTGQSKL